MQVVNLGVLLADDLVLPLRLADCLVVLLGLGFREFKPLEESILLFLLGHDCDLEAGLHFTLLVELSLLGVESFLQSGLVLLDAIFSSCEITLLGGISIVLDHRLLKQGPQPHTLVNVCLYFVVGFSVFTHFDVLFQLFNKPVFFLDLDFHVAILSFQLLNEEALKIVRLLTDRSMTTG